MLACSSIMQWCVCSVPPIRTAAVCLLTWLPTTSQLNTQNMFVFFLLIFFFSDVCAAVYSWLTTWLATLWKSNSRDSETSPDLPTPCRAFLGNSQDLANGFLTTTCLNQWPFENHPLNILESSSGSCRI